MSAIHSQSAGGKHNNALKIVFVITALFLVVEVIAGLASNSLALLSDAAHMLTDVGGQALALFAIWMASKPRNATKTYGYYRIEIFSALINALVLLGISVFILVEAWQRFKNPPEVAGASVIIVAVVGLVINLVSMKLLHAGSKESINIKGAFMEVLSDMLSSIAVIIAGVIIFATGWLYIDPIMSVLIGLFILPRTFHLLKESIDILLEAVPKDVDFDAVQKSILEHPEVLAIHDLHIWTITSGINALSAHIIMKPEANLAEVSANMAAIKNDLQHHYNISHTTIEVHTKEADYQSNIV
ncbi:MAG: cation transporter [Bacteroidetes bacterium]|nr:cation transporter [Bacteroidota bacterium]